MIVQAQGMREEVHQHRRYWQERVKVRRVVMARGEDGQSSWSATQGVGLWVEDRRTGPVGSGPDPVLSAIGCRLTAVGWLSCLRRLLATAQEKGWNLVVMELLARSLAQAQPAGGMGGLCLPSTAPGAKGQATEARGAGFLA